MGDKSEDKLKNIHVNGLLCWFVSNIDFLDVEIMIDLCESTYADKTVEEAKELLFDLCHTEDDKTQRTGRRGEHKCERHVRDIYALLQEKGRSNIPMFVAHDLNTLPP